MPIAICSSTTGPDGSRTGHRMVPNRLGERQVQIRNANTASSSAAASRRLIAGGR